MCISRICVQPPHVPWLLGQETNHQRAGGDQCSKASRLGIQRGKRHEYRGNHRETIGKMWGNDGWLDDWTMWENDVKRRWIPWTSVTSGFGVYLGLIFWHRQDQLRSRQGERTAFRWVSFHWLLSLTFLRLHHKKMPKKQTGWLLLRPSCSEFFAIHLQLGRALRCCAPPSFVRCWNKKNRRLILRQTREA